MKKLNRLAVCGATIALAASCAGETQDAYYRTFGEAKRTGAVQRGWVPSWLPESAERLHEVHDLDSNESALSFWLPKDTRWRPPKSCRDAQAGEFYGPPFWRTWIPDLTDDFVFYSCPSVESEGVPLVEAVAVQRHTGQVLHWRRYSH